MTPSNFSVSMKESDSSSTCNMESSPKISQVEMNNSEFSSPARDHQSSIQEMRQGESKESMSSTSCKTFASSCNNINDNINTLLTSFPQKDVPTKAASVLTTNVDRKNREDRSLGNIPCSMSDQSERSTCSPQVESASVCSDPVPSTVEVPSHLTRPASTPHSMAMMIQSDTSKITKMSLQSLRPSSPHKVKESSISLRRGKWTMEEEAYVARVIQDFNSGYLNAPTGTTLRSYLSDKLHCDPMRITKKFTGDSCIGKRVFHPAVRCPSNSAAIDKAQAELDALERRWRCRLDVQQRDAAKKAAASVRSNSQAAHAPAPTSRISTSYLKDTIVTRTASWLDRANAILAVGNDGNHQFTETSTLDVKSLPVEDIEDQMKEVQRLIHEGPIIQKTTVGLPRLIDLSSDPQSSHDPQKTDQVEGEILHTPLDKRPRRLSDHNLSGNEDAQALVGFLNSVRAAAAADRPSIL